MTLRTLIVRSLRFHVRSHLGVLIGAAIATAALTGALLVGDSMRASLRQRALGRLGWVHFAMAPPDRFFADYIIRYFDGSGASAPWTAGFTASSGLMLPGTASRADGSARANQVNVFGMAQFWSHDTTIPFVASNTVVLNAALAHELRAGPGDEIVLRCRKPSSMSREVALTPHNEQTVAFRLKVQAVTEPQTIGDFSLRTGQALPLNAFVHPDELAASLGLTDKANLLLTGSFHDPAQLRFANGPSVVRHMEAWLSFNHPGVAKKLGLGYRYGPTKNTAQMLRMLNGYLHSISSLEALGFELRNISNQPSLELRSSQIFLEPELVRAALAVSEDPQASFNSRKILTLLANLIRNGSNSTPYSMVAAVGAPYIPSELKDDEIVLSQWLADDLQATPGDQVSVLYFDPESGARLVERTNVFRVHSIVPFELPWADRTLMPDFPGIEKAESTSDWDAGFPLVYKIRPKDEDYWKKYKGTPKAFITLAAGQKMWGNRFGKLTAIRFVIPSDAAAERYGETLERNLLANLNFDALGLRFEPIREQALKGAAQSQDFGQLFLGFSFFLVVAALMLMALLFQLGLERRTPEIGILLALGFTPRQVRRLLLLEAAALALAGAVVGAFGGALYAKEMLTGLTTIWSRAVGAIPLHFSAAPETLAIGISASVIVAVGTIWLTLWKQARQPARELLSGIGGSQPFAVAKKCGWSAWISAPCAVAAAAIVAWALVSGNHVNAEAFFSAGCLMLIAGLAAASAWLRSLATAEGRARCPQRVAGTAEDEEIPTRSEPSRRTEDSAPCLTLTSLAIRACARRRKRSVTTVGLLACGTFLIVAIGVFRLDANRDALKPTSGTGGFTLIGQSTLPIVQDLNTPEGAQAFGLDPKILQNSRIVPFRVHDGDEASCLNLDRAQKPRILGVKPEALLSRFTFARALRDIAPRSSWLLLSPYVHAETGVIGSVHTPSIVDDAVPAIADANSLEWALHKKVGDTIDYTDERGRPFKLRLVGAVANSILQGSLIIDESEFVRRFPGDTGYRMFLIETPSNHVTQVSEQLSRALQDAGLELNSTIERLNTFSAVQNTYLSTFRVLGGLGLLLGSAGLAIVVLRNVLERRGELGLLTAVGFTGRTLQRMILIEHGALLVAGLGIGIIAAVIAVLPALLGPGRSLPYVSLGVTLSAVVANGLLWTWVSTRAALRGNLLRALRNE